MLSNSLLRKIFTALLLTLFVSAVFSTANAKKGHKGKPPEAAFTACENQAEESACSFSTPEGDTIEGSCAVPRKAEKPLVCKPNRDKKGRKERKRED